MMERKSLRKEYHCKLKINQTASSTSSFPQQVDKANFATNLHGRQARRFLSKYARSSWLVIARSSKKDAQTSYLIERDISHRHTFLQL